VEFRKISSIISAKKVKTFFLLFTFFRGEKDTIYYNWPKKQPILLQKIHLYYYGFWYFEKIVNGYQTEFRFKIMAIRRNPLYFF